MTSRRPILVTHSYYLRFDAKQWKRQEPYLPLGTLLAAAVLREDGHDVRVFDSMLAEGVGDFAKALDELRPRIVVMVEDNFNYLTKMCTTRMREAAFEMIRTARHAGCRVVVNGSDASDRAADYLEAGAGAVALGEPEATIVDVVSTWSHEASSDLFTVPGLALRAPSDAEVPDVVRTPARPVLQQLDSLPVPAWDLIDVEPYRDIWNAAHNRFSWNLVASRGCPYKCNWCAKPIFGTRYAQRTPASLANEVAYVSAQYRPDHIWYADDIFGLTGDWIESFSREVTKRNARVPFKMQSRANLMKARVVQALRDAGAEEVWLGAESGSQKVLDSMDKGTTVQQVRDATRRLQDVGIKVGWFIQLGYPGEQWADILETRDLIREERPDEIGVSVSYPLPGTTFFENVKRQLGSKTNWRDSSELAMMFRGTYSTSLYRRVRNVLHEEVSGDEKTALDGKWYDLEAFCRESGQRVAEVR